MNLTWETIDSKNSRTKLFIRIDIRPINANKLQNSKVRPTNPRERLWEKSGETSSRITLQSRVKDCDARRTGLRDGAARRGVWRFATRVSKENVSLDQPRSSPLASAFDATAEIFTSFDLVLRWDSPRPLIGGPWPRPARKGDSLARALSTLIYARCEHTYVPVRVHMCARSFVFVFVWAYMYDTYVYCVR